VRVQELIDDQILIVCNLFPPTVRLAYRRFFETEIAARLSQPVAPKRGEATRTNERFSQHDEEFAAHLYQASGLADMPELVQLSKGRLMGLNPNIRIYRYKPGAFFGPHYDDSVRETIAGRKCESAWTLLIYLSDNLVGGETQFHLGKGEVLAPPVQDGMALLHRHGHNCLLHEGLPVKSGVKWVLRSDLM
ncbi:hypothetical protein BCR37DRAFT_335408, partial [Protomyces lactucae-debilis]